jgi:iron complex outermembrane receptor protein
VVQNAEIRRSGATSLAEAIRLADGVHAARIYGPSWGITTRGFNISTANKMLVLIDGRTVYSPLFSGVFWDSQHLLLDDVEQIEVTRGPGGSVWGANAVNGVINVITKPAHDTQGWLVNLAAGNELDTIAGVRYGGRLGHASYRAYGRFRAEDEHVFASGAPSRDDMQVGHGGFRIDAGSAKSGWMLQSDWFRSSAGLFDRPDTTAWGGHVLGRWVRPAGRGIVRLQGYYDHGYRRVVNQYQATRDTVDVDLQHQAPLGTRHQIVAGAAARVSHGDDLGQGGGFFFDPRRRTQTLLSGFVQDEIAIRPGRVFVTLGAKVERNNYTNVELSPTARVRWRATNRQTAWAAVSRAVRLPTRFDTDLRIRVAPGGPVLIAGNPDFESETVLAVEGGYRALVSDRLSIDAAVYRNRYTDVRSLEAPEAPGAPIVLGNTLRARSAGLEAAASTDVTRWWVVRASYSYHWKAFGRHDGSRAVSLVPGQAPEATEANDPSHLFSLRSHVEFRSMEFDAVLYGAGRLPDPPVDAYAELDARLGFRVRPEWELAIVGQNLLNDRHLEFAAGTPPQLFERAIYLRSTWRY